MSKPTGKCNGSGLCGCGSDYCAYSMFCAQWTTGVCFAISECAEHNPRRDDERWNERIRLLAGGDDEQSNAA